MKLAYLLAQYLYTNKRLDLPGIGTFLFDPSVIIDTENSKQRNTAPEGISFQNNPAIKNASELVSYISSRSGKMKPLAESDLESHLQMAQQFLNISKPFTFDGIGTLIKKKSGDFEFTAGNIIPEKLKDNRERDLQGLTKKETIDAKYQAYLATPVIKSRWRKPVIVFLILCGIGLAVWGGYTISTRQNEKPEVTLSEGTSETAIPFDSSNLNKKDSTMVPVVKIVPASDNYKYVLEVSKATKAFNRYKQLKDTKLSDVLRMETSDSLQYKLFVLLPVTSDTTKVIDSLTAFLGKRVHIERQN